MRNRTPTKDTSEDATDEAEIMQDIETAIESLASEGLIVDSGRRRFSPRTGQFEIVWVAAHITTTLHRRKITFANF